RNGEIDPSAERHAKRLREPLALLFQAWLANMKDKGSTDKHRTLFATRAKRVVALVMGAKLSEVEAAKNAPRDLVQRASESLEDCIKTARLSEIDAESVQQALARLKAHGRSHATLNHHLMAIRCFVSWCYGKKRENPLQGVTGYNVDADPRH